MGWGENGFHQLGDLPPSGSFAPVQIHGLPPGIVQVAAGSTHGVALAADGSVWTWGAAGLGYPAPPGGSPTPHQVPGLSGVKQVAAGIDFTVALRSNGEVWTWGANNFGQLGDGTHIDRRTPARSLAGYGITQVSGRYSLCSTRAARFRVAASPGSTAITAAAASQPTAITASSASGRATTGVMPS